MRASGRRRPLPELHFTRTRSALVTLDLSKGTAKQELLSGAVEFPVIDARFTGLRNRHLYTVARTYESTQRVGFNAVMWRATSACCRCLTRKN